MPDGAGWTLTQHTLVYVVKNSSQRGQMHVIRSMDDIEAIHLKLEKEQQEADAKEKQFAEHFPALDRLEKLFGRRKAYRLSFLLGEVKQKGEVAVMETMAKSSWYRIKKEWAAAEIEI